MPTPRVTWLLPVRNAEQYLEQTLRCIAKQDYPKHRVLAWDDGSSDRTREILAQWVGVRIPGGVVSHERVGLGLALAHLVVEAKTELIARIDADDTAEPTRLSEQVRYMVEHPRVGLLNTYMRVIGEPGRVIKQPRRDPELRWALRFTNPVSHPSVMLRRSAVLEVGNYRALPAGEEDYDLWARLGLVARFSTLTKPLTNYRVHAGSATAGWSQAHGEAFYRRRNAMIDRLLPGIAHSDGVRLLDLVRRPDDLSVTADDLVRFRHAAMLAAQACRYPPDYFTSTKLFQQQYENLRTRRLKGRPLIRPVWPLLKHAKRIMIDYNPRPKSKDNAAA